MTGVNCLFWRNNQSRFLGGVPVSRQCVALAVGSLGQDTYFHYVLGLHWGH